MLAFLKGGAGYVQAVLMTTVGQRVVADIQLALFARLMRADIAFFHANPTGTLISRFTMDTLILRSAATNVLAALGKEAVTAVFLIALMFYQDWVLALVAFVAFPLALQPMSRVARRMRRVSADTQVEFGQFTTLLNQSFQGARHVKAYGMEAYETSRAGHVIEKLYKLVQRAGRTRSVSSPLMETLGGIAVALVVLYGGHQVISGVRTPGTFFSFVTALLLAYQPMKNLAGLNVSLQEGLAGAQRIFAVLDLEPEIRDRPNATPLRVTGGEIVFDAVRFTYANGGEALRGTSLVVPAGKTVALVGASGAGKSTILNLIPRFYDVAAGAVRIDGADVRDVTLASLRGAIALVSQEVTLFDDTVRANIAYGRFGASEDEIVAAAAGAAAARVRARPAAGLRHARRRARRQALGRTAPAHRHRPRHAQERADPALGRGDGGARHGIRAPGPGRAPRAHARPHHGGDRAPALDRARCRPDLRRRERARRRSGQPCRAAAPRRRLCAAPCAAIRERTAWRRKSAGLRWAS